MPEETRSTAVAAKSSTLPPVIAGVVLLIGAAIFSWTMLRASPPDVAARGASRAPKVVTTTAGTVRVAVVEEGKLDRTRRVAGTLFAPARAVLRARVQGQVERIAFRLGARVEAGAMLASLSVGTLRAELERARALAVAADVQQERAAAVAAKATRDRERRRRLVQSGAISGTELDDVEVQADLALLDARLAEADAARAKADVKVLEVRLQETRVVAPFAGRVATVFVEEGDIVAPGTSLVEIVGADQLQVRFAVGEGEARFLRVGAPVEVFGASGLSEGEVVRIGAAVRPESRTLDVEAVLKAPLPEGFLPGVLVDVTVAIGASETTTMVPIEALRGSGPRRRIFVVDADSKVGEVEARVLLEDGGRAAVLGLEPGQRVIVSGPDTLQNGAAVQVVQ